MAKSLSHISDARAVAGPHRAITARLIRFLSDAPAGVKVLRTYHRPRACFAVEEEFDLVELPTATAWPEPADQLIVLLLPPPPESKLDESFMATPSHPDAVATIAFASSARKIQWRPGRALIGGPLEDYQAILRALVDFAFYEGELRGFEAALEQREAQAQSDIEHAHRIRLSDRKHWRRFAQTIEYLYHMRLKYARLESQLAVAERSLPRESRQVMARLNDESRISTRMEALSNRLEAFEDLYEGANDRITDHRWYVASQWLELGIVLILVVEVLLLAIGPYLWRLK
ncbi:MAG: hypothetical protein ACREQ4_08530 [Candidatus Binataceae bacterium]